MEQYDVTALGELLIDFAPYSTNEAGYPVLSANPGGAPGNFLAALSRYGCKTAMIGKVGADSFGRALIGTLQEAGIDTRGILARFPGRVREPGFQLCPETRRRYLPDSGRSG